jgi:thymidylate synthase (FAD)
MTTAKLIWATPNVDAVIGYCARVSNPANQDNEDVTKLLRYCAKHKHWSIFEMAHACIELNTTRDIARQVLRHRSFSFQEFSQRYQTVEALGGFTPREFRKQDPKNRQSSTEVAPDSDLATEWRQRQEDLLEHIKEHYIWALSVGCAKEQARAVLPEGLTPSRLYVSGTMRSWITYLQARLDESTQKEHRLLATVIWRELYKVAPITVSAFFPQDA